MTAEPILHRTTPTGAPTDFGRSAATSAAIDPGLQLVATETAATWVKYVGSKPAAYRVRKPSEQMPERDERGNVGESDREAGPKSSTA